MRRLRGMTRTSGGVFFTDTCAVHVLVASITYQHGPEWGFTLQCALITLQIANVGLFRGRNQFSYRVSYDVS
jgi:hypothetical protein